MNINRIIKNNLATLAATTLLVVSLGACNDEIYTAGKTPTQTAGQLTVGQIIIDGLQDNRATTRAVFEDGTSHCAEVDGGIRNCPPNTAIRSLENGDLLYANYNFTGADLDKTSHYEANFQKDKDTGAWTFGNTGLYNPTFYVRPDEDKEGESWAKTRMRIRATGYDGNGFLDGIMVYINASSANIETGSEPGGTDSQHENPQYVIIPGIAEQVKEHLYFDALVAETGTMNEDGGIEGETDAQGEVLKGRIAIDRNPDSPTLGLIRANLIHAGALMRLKDEDIKIDGESKPELLKYLWAYVKATNLEPSDYSSDKEYYVPFTAVTVNGTTYRQAIIPAGATVAGFVIVTSAGANGDTPGNNILVGWDESEQRILEANTRYPLKIEVSNTTRSQVTFVTPDGLPGWGEQEDETDLVMNYQYIGIGDNGGHSYEVYTAKGLKELAEWINGTSDSNNEDIPTPAPDSGDNNPVDEENRNKTNITLMRNIVLPAPANKNESNWTPLGHNYTGTFDGNGKTISGMKFVEHGNNMALIGSTDDGGVVKNLTMQEIDIRKNQNSNALIQTSAIVGYNSGGILINCHASGSIDAHSSAPSANIAGIAGGNSFGGVIIACSSTVTVYSQNEVGGIVGSNYISSIIGCWNTGKVSASTYGGSIVGENDISSGGTIAGNWGSAPQDGTGNKYSVEIDAVTDYTSLNADDNIKAMNDAIDAYNNGQSNEALKCPYHWQAGANAATDLPVLVKKPTN